MTPEQRRELERLCALAEKGELVSSMAEAMEYMTGCNLAWKMVIKPSMLGVHPENRDGQGIDISHVQNLVVSVCQMGWNPSLTSPICIEVPPSDEHSFLSFNQKLADESLGKLPQPEVPLRFATISSSHTSMMMKTIVSGCYHPSEALTNSSGRLQMSMVPKNLQESCKHGLTWTVLASSVTGIPGLIALLQSAANASQQVAKGEDELQMALKIAAAIKSRPSLQQNLSWQKISGEVLRSRPRCAGHCDSIFVFVRKYAADRLGDTEAFIRAEGVPSRFLGPVTWETLIAEMKGDQRIWWRHSVLKFAYSCGDRQWHDSDVAWIWFSWFG